MSSQDTTTALDTCQAPKTGMKFDGGKAKWSLLMRGLSSSLEGVVAVLGFGAQKYAADSWQQVDNGYERYKDALYRHLARIEQNGIGAVDIDMQPDGNGGYVDKGSGLLDWFHVACDALFCAWFAAKAAREAAAKDTH